MATLYLIDGYAAFYRCYHAIRTPMSSPVTKEPTNMTFGFVGLMLKLLKADGASLIKAGRPDYIALALDVSGDRGTFRSQIYPEYKAQRPPPPPDLEPQVDRCLAMLREIGVPIVGAEGYEADDVIATLVTKLRQIHPDLAIRMVSKDKDLKQLLEGEQVELFDVHTDNPFSEQTLYAETGLRPNQVVDMLTLVGDTVDNVPGIDTVGDKVAAQWIKEYGSLDNLVANAPKVPGKRGEKLRAALDQLPLVKQLISLRRDVPVDLELTSASVPSLKLDRLPAIFRELGFNRYQDEIKTILNANASGRTESDRPAPAPAAPARPAPPPRGGLFDTPATTSSAPIKAQSGDYGCIATRDQLAALVAELRSAPVIAVDTETTALSPHTAKLCGVSISTKIGTGWYIPVKSPTPAKHLDEKTVLGVLRLFLEDPDKAKTGHNLKFDINILRAHGVTLRGLTAPGGCDSMIASYLIDPSRSSHSLDALSLALLNRTNISIKELIGTGPDQGTFDSVPVNDATQYAAEDADVALQLRSNMMPQLESMGLLPLARDVELPLVEVLAELEWNGIKVDAAELDRQRARLSGQIDSLMKQIATESRSQLGRTFDPDSPKQLAAALFNGPDDEPPGLGIKGAKRTKTGFSTDAEVLEELADNDAITTQIPRLILEYRQLTKLVSTYLVALKEAIHPKTGRVHSSFNQTVAATGRLASHDPNLQNIPIRTDVGRDIRKAFVAPPGRTLITADYSQIELRLLAHLSRDPALIQAFQEGQDIHTAVAAQIHGIPLDQVTREQRNGAKMVNFGIVYGITSYGLARRLKIEQAKAAEIIDGYKRKFSGITTFLQECVEHARGKGYVETMLKRRRPIAETDSPNPSRRALAERLAINSVVQGSAADLIKIAMVDLHRRIIDARTDPRNPLHGTLMLLQIHDELVFEAPTESADAVKAVVVERMEQAMSISVPLKVDAHAAPNWYEGK
ncbi:MAG: DNA polymerase I [Planctomycetes bacterium]|nr:DNA polymerase I [Planctomycetota bacterium]